MKGFTPLEKDPDGVRGEYQGDVGGSSPEANPPLAEKPLLSITVSPIRNNISNGIKGRSSLTGFTLIEILISILVLSVIIFALFSIFEVGRNAYYSNDALINVQQVARKTMSDMESELRQSRASGITISNGGARIDFTVPRTLSPVTYSSNISYYLSNNRILREHPAGTANIIAVNIDSLNFSLSGNILSITLQARGDLKNQDITLPLKETIRLRN